MPRSDGTSIVRFGLFEADLQTGELRRDGQKVRLQEQPFQLLAVLLERPGEVLTREELRARLWPSDTFVDFDHGLNAAIRRLRDALGDSAENPRFVETLARRGYRFIAPVEPRQDKSPAQLSSLKSSWDRHRWFVVCAAAALVLAAVAGASWIAGRKSVAAVSPENRRLTGNPGNDPVWGAAVSPDGKYLVFADNSGLFLRVLNSVETHALLETSDGKTSQVSWFPDGMRLLATRTDAPNHKPGLWSVSVLGGAPQKLIDDGSAGVVSRDGARIAFRRGDYNRQELWVIEADGEHPRKILGAEGGEYGSLAWSPDGKHLAFLRYVYAPDYNKGEVSVEICDAAAGVNSAESSAAKVILSNSRLWNALAWTPDNRLIYSLGESPPNRTDSNLWAQKIDPQTFKPLGAPVRITTGPEGKAHLALSADGKRLSYLRVAYAPHIYVSSVDQRGGQLGPLRRLSLDERGNYPYDWTADGKSLVFISDRDGISHLFKQGLNDPVPQLLAGGDSSVVIARLDPAGTFVLYLLTAPPNEPSEPMRIMRVPVSGGVPEIVLSQPAINNFQCARSNANVCLLSQYSPDRLTFYGFDPVSGKETLLKILDDPDWSLFNWSLSPDGKTLALAKKARATTPSEILLRALDGHNERTIHLENWFAIDYLDWAADGRSLWVNAVSARGTPTLLSVSTNGTVVPALEEPEMVLGWAIPSRDGRQVALWRGEQNANAWLLEGF